MWWAAGFMWLKDPLPPAPAGRLGPLWYGPCPAAAAAAAAAEGESGSMEASVPVYEATLSRRDESRTARLSSAALLMRSCCNRASCRLPSSSSLSGSPSFVVMRNNLCNAVWGGVRGRKFQRGLARGKQRGE